MKNNKKKYPYNDNIDIEECVFIRNYKYIEKDFMDQKSKNVVNTLIFLLQKILLLQVYW